MAAPTLAKLDAQDKSGLGKSEFTTASDAAEHHTIYYQLVED